MTATDLDLHASWEQIAAVRAEPATGEIKYGKHEPLESQLNLLGNLQGKRVLDLGCGAGGNCLAFARAGAEVAGVDFSTNQIEKARSLCAGLDSVRFHVSDLLQFTESQPESSYDVVFSSFVLLYIDRLESLFAQIRRILRPGGVFVFSTKHRLGEIAIVEAGRVVIRESYFETGRYEWTWTNESEKVPLVSYSRTPGQTVAALSDAGFIIERLIEPEPVAEDSALTEDELTLGAMLPTAMIWKARRG
jgi:SAM-dependent methyltransferase